MEKRYIIYDYEDQNVYKPKEEENLEGSYFKSQYSKILDLINEIIKSNNCKHYIRDVNKEYCNNIIAIIGKRGTGKSSIIYTILKALKDSKGDCRFDEFNGIGFNVLDPIDPSKFERNDSIIKIIISQLFKTYKDKIGDYQNEDIFNNYINDNRELLKQFQVVYRSLKYLSLEDEKIFEQNIDELEILSELSASLGLKKSLGSLIKQYLKCMNRFNNKEYYHNENKEDYLIIPIDDVDMNMEHAYKMVEDIRKYLFQYNIIILMGLNLEQLEDVVNQKYIKDYNVKINQENMFIKELQIYEGRLGENRSNFEYKDIFSTRKKISTMTLNYFEKLIPEDRRVYINPPNYHDIKIKRPTGYTEIKCELDNILKIGFKMTCDFSHQNSYDFLFPESLRGKLNLVHMFENYRRYAERNNQIVLSNIEHLLNYIKQNWIKEYSKNNKDEKSKIILDFLKNNKENNLKKIYKTFINKFENILNHSFDNNENIENYIIKYLINNKEDLNPGDMATLLELLFDQYDDKSLFSLLKLYYFLISKKCLYDSDKLSKENNLIGIMPLYIASQKGKEHLFLYDDASIKFTLLMSKNTVFYKKIYEKSYKQDIKNRKYVLPYSEADFEHDNSSYYEIDFVKEISEQIVEKYIENEKSIDLNNNYMKGSDDFTHNILYKSKKINLTNIKEDMKKIKEKLFYPVKNYKIEDEVNFMNVMKELNNNITLEEIINISDDYDEIYTLLEINKNNYIFNEKDYLLNENSMKIIRIINNFYDFKKRFIKLNNLKLFIIYRLKQIKNERIDEIDNDNEFISNYIRMFRNIIFRMEHDILLRKVNRKTDDSRPVVKYGLSLQNANNNINKFIGQAINLLEEIPNDKIINYLKELKYLFNKENKEKIEELLAIERECNTIENDLQYWIDIISNDNLDELLSYEENLDKFLNEQV